MTRDERSASFMADVYARVSGRIGVCEGPSGGGATYILPGVAEAQGSAIPLLCLTSDTPVDQHGRGVLTELDQESLFRPVTKWNTRVNSAATVAKAPAARSAWLLLVAPERPIYRFQLTSWKERPRIYPFTAFRTSGPLPAMRTVPDQALVERAAAELAAATRPVIVAGGGVLTSQAWNELTALAETFNIPVATSINGKGSIAETSAVAVGVIGGNGARQYANACLADADLVLYVGSRTDSTTTCHWTLPPADNAPKVIQVDIEPFEVGKNYPLVVGLLGDAKLTLAALLEAIARPGAVGARNQARTTQLQEEGRRYWREVERQAAELAWPIKPAQVIRAMRGALDDETIIVADPGTPTPFLSAQYELRRPGRTTVIPRAHGGLGYAIPGVVGAWYAAEAAASSA